MQNAQTRCDDRGSEKKFNMRTELKLKQCKGMLY